MFSLDCTTLSDVRVVLVFYNFKWRPNGFFQLCDHNLVFLIR